MKKILTIIALLTTTFALFADDIKLVPTVAVLPFEARNRVNAQNNEGKSIAELLTIALLESGNAELVERAELDKALAELQLSATGMLSKDSQHKLGQLVGAKILITGSIFQAGGKDYLVAKLIGTETSRVIGCSVSGTGDFATMTGELAKKINLLMDKSSEKLLPKLVNQKTTLITLSEIVNGKNRKVYVDISKNKTVLNSNPADTELRKLLLDLGFKVVNDRQDADFTITGNAIVSQAGNYQAFTSASAKIEMSIFSNDKKLLATSSCKETLAGASYIIAANEAIAQGTLRLAEELFMVMK